MTGNLPTHLRIIATKPRPVETDWEDGVIEKGPITARAAYVSDESNETTIERGREWARSYRHAGVSREFTVPNTPVFTANTRVVGLEKRAEGGRAWKAVIVWDGEHYLVDLREDLLLTLILGPGIGAEGVIKAPLVWGKVGSQMKLIVEGSDIHAELVAATAVDKVKPPKAGDLKVGDVWEAKNGDRAAFLGWVSTIKMTSKEDRWDHANDKITLTRVPRAQAWYSIPAYEQDALQKAMNECLYFRLDIKQSCSYRKPAGKVKVPTDWAARVEADIRKGWAEERNRYESHFRAANMVGWCNRMHIGAPGEVVPLKAEWSQWAHLLT